MPAASRRRRSVRRTGPITGLPDWIPPQLTKLTETVPEGDQWAHEIKVDGYRMHGRLDRWSKAQIPGMKQHYLPVVIQGLEITSVTRKPASWEISADALPDPICPGCGRPSVSCHSGYERRLSDLPIQGVPVHLRVRVARWRCRNARCSRAIFVQRLPGIAAVGAHRTRRTADIIALFGHAVGSRPGERLMHRLGTPVSDDTLLRHVKAAARSARPAASLRVVGVDDWAWQKGQSYCTILVDLERRVVADVLADRSSASVGAWLAKHPTVRIDDAGHSGIYAMQRFARKVRQDIEAVTNALREPWSSGQVEGQISRLKTLKRSMYGRAGAELLRARMLPISALTLHQV